MPGDSRDTVISVRITEEAQLRLKEVAAERGTSVSALVRSVVLREVQEAPAAAPTVTASASSATPRTDHGLYWAEQPGALILGATFTI